MINILFLDRDWKDKKNGATYWREGITKALSKKSSIDTWIVSSNIILALIFLWKNRSTFKKADIIQTHIADFSIIIICIIAKLFNKKHVHMLHGDYMVEKKDKGIIMFIKYELIVKIADLVLFPTNYLRKEILKKKKIKKTFVLAPGITLDKINIPHNLLKKPKKFIDITSFHRYDKARGLIPLINAFNECKEKNDSLTIVGGGVYFNEFKNKFSSKDVLFLGARNDVETLLKNSDLFVHSSFLESFGIVILEAMKERLPIITVNIGGIPEAAGDAALIVRPNKDALKKAIIKLKNDKKFRIELVKKQTPHLKEYSWEKISKTLLTTYNKLLNNDYQAF